MSKMLQIADDLMLPLEAVTETFGVLAMRGAGKSNLAAVMAEQMFAAGLPFVVIDPVGSWYGLRAGADGSKDGGLAVPIFGGRHGDVPLERHGGELLADLVTSKRLSCVLDLTGFESEGAKKAFLLDFARRLYLKNTDPLHLFLEEADDYIPQRPQRDEAQLLRAWENIVRRGRARGLGMTLITQRSASVNKSVLTQVQTLFVLRTTGPQDRAAIEAWVKYHDVDGGVLASLSGLGPGEGWVWSPHFLGRMSKHQFHRRRTFDSGATPQNLRGKDARPVATLADVDLGALEQQMAATIERAKADDPKELRKRIAELEREPKNVERSLETSAGVQNLNAEVREVLTDADRELLRGLRGDFQEFVDAIATRADHTLTAIAERAKGEVDAAAARWSFDVDRRRTLFLQRLEKARVQRVLDKLERVAITDSRIPGSRESAPYETRPNRQAQAATGGEAMPPGERAVLTAAAQYGVDGVTRDQLGVLTGYKRSSRDAYVARLSAKGWLESVNGSVLATPAGIQALGPDFEPLPTGPALLDWWRARLPKGERDVLEVLVAAGGRPVERAAIDDRTGFKRSSRDAYLSRLSSRRLVKPAGVGQVRASEEIFA